MSGSLLQNPLLSINDPSQTGNPLTQGSPTLADAFQYNANAAADWLQKQRDQSVAMGLWDPNTGLPTAQGVVNAGQQYAGAMLGSTAAPGETIPGVADRISTRVPWAKNQTIDPHANADLQVGLPSSVASTAAYAKNANIIDGYGDIPTQGMDDPDSLSNALIQHTKDNLLYLYNNMPPEVRDRAMQWYDGANTIANQWADKYGLEPRQTAGLLASLSPQKDWFQNVDLAQRVLDTTQRQGNMTATPEMQPWLQKFVDMQKDPGDAAAYQGHIDSFADTPLAQVTDPTAKALWIRAYDEAHNDRGYNLVTPEGDFGGPVLNQDGSARKVGWGSFDEIAKGVGVLQDGDLSNISQLMGGNHKVRNFYNNIISPNAPDGDVTIDTHAIAAAHMRPLSGSDPEVSNGLGLTGSSAAATGSRGLYGLYAEGYRQAADQLGILPRQLQSITWEGVRGLYSDVQKRNQQFTSGINDIWNRYGSGQIDANTARDSAVDAAGGINPPEWFQSGSQGNAGTGGAANP